MTEQEAKTKWCPFARAESSEDNPAAINRLFRKGSPDNDCYCIGSACMVWRELPVDDNRPRELWSKKTGELATSTWGEDGEWRLVNPDDPLPPAQGFCGLAGKP